MARSSTFESPAATGTEAGSCAAVVASDLLTLRRIAGLLEADGWSVLPCDRPDPGVRAVLACVDIGGRAPADEIRVIRHEAPDAALVLVTPPALGSDIRRALRAGADGVVFDAQLDVTLAPAVQAACAGMAVVPREARNHLEKPVLSHREKQILNLVVTGLTNRQIASRLFLAESTVKTHLTTAFGKLGVRSRSEATAVLLDPDEPLLAGFVSEDDQAEPPLLGYQTSFDAVLTEAQTVERG
jgi:DNA-binding NarL/FixJ family response regulator